MELGDQVATASDLIGLLLAIDTLFTAEQGRRLAEERKREGGADRRALRMIQLVSIGLAAVTSCAVVALFPLFRDVLAAVGEPNWEPVLAVFELAWLLLIALTGWQVILAWNSRTPT
jgi:hypothetical protein